MFAKIDWTQGVDDAWSKIAQGAPKIIYFVAVLIIGLFVAKVLGGWTKRLLDKAGAPRFAERMKLQPHLARAGFTLSSLGGRAVKLFITFIAVTTAFAVFGPTNPVSRLLDRFVAYIPNIFVAAAILAITAVAAQFVANALRRLTSVTEGATKTNLPNFLPSLASVAVWVVGTFAALDQLQIAPAVVHGVFYAALAALVGVTIVAVGGGGIATMSKQWERVLGQRGAIDLRPSTDQHVDQRATERI